MPFGFWCGCLFIGSLRPLAGYAVDMVLENGAVQGCSAGGSMVSLLWLHFDGFLGLGPRNLVLIPRHLDTERCAIGVLWWMNNELITLNNVVMSFRH